MFKKLSSSLLIVSVCVFSSCTSTVKQEIAILPTPVSPVSYTHLTLPTTSRV